MFETFDQPNTKWFAGFADFSVLFHASGIIPVILKKGGQTLPYTFQGGI